MQLVAMAAVLAVAGAGRVCSFDCRLVNVSIDMWSCAGIETVHTTMCEGQCYQGDPSYTGPMVLRSEDQQKTCNADWSYQVKHVRGCPEGVTYPVATNCKCTLCDSDHMHCGRLYEDISTCPSF